MCEEFEVTDPAAKELIEKTVDQFSLNDQERVFQIVVNHGASVIVAHRNTMVWDMCTTECSVE